MGVKRNICMIFVGNPEGKRPLGRARHRWEDNIKMDLIEIEFGGLVWIVIGQVKDQWRALVNTVMIFGFHECWEILE
jgi:hypothetical protein